MVKTSVGGNVRWIALSQAFRVLVQVIGLIVLTRLLSPSDYGIMAMALVVVNFSNLLRDMGTAAAIIQKVELKIETINTIFWFNVVVGFLIAVTLLILSPYIAASFQAPSLEPVVQWLALAFPITSVGSVHQALLERESRFKGMARIEITSSACALAIGLLLAKMDFGVYSLVAQTLITAILLTSQLWMASVWRPALDWELSELKSLWGFSGNLTFFGFVNYFSRNADSMVIGRILGAVELGVYSQAYRIMLFPLQNMTFVATRALFPVMSRQQDSVDAMALSYLKVLSVVALTTAPLMAGMWVLREPFVLLVFGQKWLSVVPLLAILAPVGFIQSLISTTGTVFMSVGRTDIMVRLGVIGAILQVCAFLVGVHWGVKGVAMCYLLANIVNFFPCFYLTTKVIGLKINVIFYAVYKQIFAALLMMAVMFLIGFIFGESIILSFLVQGVCGVFFYTVTWYFLNGRKLMI